jgi:hypothetical protein
LLAGSVFLLAGLLGPPPHRPSWTAAAMAPSPAVWTMAGLAVLFWVPWLLLGQPAQRRRTQFVRRLRSGELAHALCDLAALRPADFPPSWDPAAALARPAFAPRLLEAARLAARLPAGSWVRACFLRRLGQALPVWADPVDLWLQNEDRMPDAQMQELAGLCELLRQVPEGRDILGPYQDYLAELCAYTRERDPRRCEVLQGLLALALKRGSRR